MPDFTAIRNPNAANSEISLKNGELEKPTDIEQLHAHSLTPISEKQSVYKGLGWLDRLLVLWIFLAIMVGILLGNYVPSVGPALQKGKFVQVSVPIGE
jgi:ACR3 family arsenite transporter